LVNGSAKNFVAKFFAGR